MKTFPQPGTLHLCGEGLRWSGRGDELVGVRAQVRLQHALGAEGGVAAGEAALEGSLALRGSEGSSRAYGVLELVLVQLRGGAEALVAAVHVAEVRLLVAVDAQVARQAALRREALLADLARKRLRDTPRRKEIP